MKIKLFLLFSAMITASCGVFLGENQRNVTYKTESGTTIHLSIHENRFPLTERKYLVVSSGDHPLTGKDCENSELKKFSREVWSEIVKNNDLSGINSVAIDLKKEVIDNVPKHCSFKYSRKDGGEWNNQW